MSKQVYEVFVRGSVDQVWQAIVDGKKSAQYYFGTAFESSLETGAPYRYTFPDGTVAVEGKVLECTPKRALVTTWEIKYDPSCAGEDSRVQWSLEPRGTTTKVTLTHDLPNAPNSAKSVANDGWSFVLSGLKSLVETGKALDLPQMS
jgi:uncharacterized protein YndB with AHSA1/START domain